MPTELRESQVETLRVIAGGPPEGLRPLAVAVALKRGEHSTERSLIRLAERGFVRRSSRRFPAYGGFSIYSLTSKGKATLLDREGSR